MKKFELLKSFPLIVILFLRILSWRKLSTLFLNQNKTSLVSNNINLKLGEANNLNPIHFSTNIGMGFKYQFIKSFQINVEPMVKYQLNTYSNNSSNYKPVFIGLYSGIGYAF